MNMKLASSVINFAPPHDIPMPRDFAVLQVGITTRCNQICAHCPRETRYEGMSTMSLEKFDSYLGQFDAGNFRGLIVSDFGEITIIPELLDYLRAARRHGFRGVHFVTNATRNDADFWHAIARERLISYLIVSLEAAEDPLYKRIRGHSFAHFHSVLQLIEKAFSSATPAIPFLLNAVCMKENLDQLPAITRLAADVNAHELHFVHLNPTNYANRSPDKLCVESQHLDTCVRSDVLKVFAEVIQIAADRNLKIRLPEPFPELTDDSSLRTSPAAEAAPPALLCDRPLKWVQVGMSGEIYPCCQMSQRVSMGNLEQKSFADIWTDQGYRSLLTGLTPGNQPLSVCMECNILRGKNF